MESTNDHQREALIYRIQGDVLLLQDLPAEQWAAVQQKAEDCFRRATAVAQEQQAKLWEARASASLCRLLHPQDRAEEALQQLTDL